MQVSKISLKRSSLKEFSTQEYSRHASLRDVLVMLITRTFLLKTS